jgi:hypothetical protein
MHTRDPSLVAAQLPQQRCPELHPRPSEQTSETLAKTSRGGMVLSAGSVSNMNLFQRGR